MRNVALVALSLLVGGGSWAEIVAVDSLEWMTVDAQAVIRAKVTGHRDTKGPDGAGCREITLRVEDAIKGDVTGRTLTVRRHGLGPNPGMVDHWQRTGHALLLFLRKGRAEDGKALAGQWVLRDPQRSIIDLDGPPLAYLADMTASRDADKIMEVVRHYAARSRPLLKAGAPNVFRPQAGYARLEIPPSAKIYGFVYSGSTCYIHVPIEPAHRELALARIRDGSPHVRASGADLLRNFPGPETVRILTDLLDDPVEAQSCRGPGELVLVTYPVRKAACDALRALGGKPEEPAFAREPTAAEVVAYRNAYWTDAAHRAIGDHGKRWKATVQDVAAPPLWTRLHGPDGLAIRCVRPAEAPGRPKSPGRVVVTLYAMPRDWSGRSSLDTGERLLDGKYTAAGAEEQAPQEAPPRYLGLTSGRHLFYAGTGVPRGWRLDMTVARYFHPAIANAYIESTGIREISESAPGYAHRTFSSNGWAHAGHRSGARDRPRIYQEEVLVPQPTLVAIWRAAAALDRKLLEAKHDPEGRHHLRLAVTFADDRRVVLGWHRGTTRRDPKVKKLLGLLSATGYGAW